MRENYKYKNSLASLKESKKLIKIKYSFRIRIIETIKVG